MPTKLLVVSIDGVAPRFATPDTMPNLLALARSGVSTFDARTVHPSITLPAHASMLRGIDPSVHGILDNTPRPLSDGWPTFLQAARDAGQSTAALLNWRPMRTLVEPDAAEQSFFLDGGYADDDDDRMAAAAEAVLAGEVDLAFVYLVSPDNAGHAFGWGSPAYLDALRRSDRALARVLAAAGEDSAVLVTTDHGGHGNDHQASEPIDMITFAVLRAPGIGPCSTWAEPVSILDVAPTVAGFFDFDPPAAWSGRSLLEGIVPIADHLLGLVARMQAHTYGERLSMLEHSLQTAAQLEAEGAADDLIVAGLLHDIGHLLGDAGDWGLPDHADAGAVHLQGWLPESVVEPVRLHVPAKRHLVAVDAEYAARLSEASTVTLAQQGGPFSAVESTEFEANPWARDAVQLRMADEAGKDTENSADALVRWRPLLARVLERATPSTTWLRDACCCPACRDVGNGQRLVSASDADGWWVAGQRDGRWVLRHDDHGDHVVVLDEGQRPVPLEQVSDRREVARHRAEETDAIVADLVEHGLVVATGLGTTEGRVLGLARRIGFVRETNYGELFDVRNEPDPTNLAYTSLGLPLHTDNPYRDPVPGVQLLHCLRPASSGGDSRFADGFAAAARLRTLDPDAFELLSTVAVRFEYRSADAWLTADRPIIETDADGRVVAVAVNHRSMRVDAEAHGWYDAYRRFVDVVEDPAHVIDVSLGAGEVALFHNTRVLHARTAFDTSEPRHLQGCYIDLDAVRSSARLSAEV